MEKEKTNFNTYHPELRPGEIFLMNATNADFQHCMFATKCQGKQAYTNGGIPLRNYYEFDLPPPVFPVFIEVWEKELHGKGLAIGYKKEE